MLSRRPLAEGHDLHRQRELGAEHGRQLRLVDDDDLAPAGLGHDLLVQQGAPAAFDEVELRVDLVGPVDGDVDDGMVGERRERDA